MSKIPMDESVIMQVVVKVKSIQSLQKFRRGVGQREESIIQGPGDQPKTMVEYVVLQRMMIEGKLNDWMIWGTTQESKVEDVLGEENSLRSPAIGKP